MKEKWSDLQWLTGFQRQPELGGCRSADPSRSPLEVWQCRVFRKRMSGGIIISQFGLPIPIPPPPPHQPPPLPQELERGQLCWVNLPYSHPYAEKGSASAFVPVVFPCDAVTRKKTCAQLCNCTNRKWRLWQGHLRSCCALFQTFVWNLILKRFCLLPEDSPCFFLYWQDTLLPHRLPIQMQCTHSLWLHDSDIFCKILFLVYLIISTFRLEDQSWELNISYLLCFSWNLKLFYVIKSQNINQIFFWLWQF